MSTLSLIIFASLAVSVLSLIGIISLSSEKFSSKKIVNYLVSFAAGVMLSAAFLDLLPKAFEKSLEVNTVLLLTLGGIVLSFFIERFLFWFHHHHGTHQINPSTLLILLGDGLHNFIDGLAIAAAFLTTPALGLSTTIAIAFHELPQEFADFSILVHSGMKKFKALMLNFFSALTAVFGALIGFYFLSLFDSVIPTMLGLTAGMFIYIACADLIPDLHQDFKKQQGWIQSLPFIVGIAIMWILVQYFEG